MKYLNLIIIITLLAGCSSAGKKKITEKNNIEIRYINLRLVYDTFLKKNSDYRLLKHSRDDLISKIKTIEEELFTYTENKRKKIEEYKIKKKELIELEKRISFFKSRILSRINRAIRVVADEMNVDYVLSIGDEVIYAKRRYDISEDVIRTIVKMEHRTSPVSR